ncbi:MAG: CIA30 family protein [Bacilli bacterium]|nr:CIA30 family protein [Bacilli bacterium]MBN2696408.1 CIA30 family protein [Bacilli bacterium]
MFKKAIILALMSLSFLIFGFDARAEEYLNYQEIIFDSDDAVLLKDYTDTDYADFYKQLPKRKFMGWNVHVVNKNEQVEFVSETKLKIYNNGYSTIKHEIKLDTEEKTSYQISASGSISMNVKGDVKKFKGTLDADIKAAVSYTQTSTSSESYEFVIIVDPKTYVTIVTRGEGEISNGVAKSYFFWIETGSGGWEAFTVKTEYYEIIKEKIG